MLPNIYLFTKRRLIDLTFLGAALLLLGGLGMLATLLYRQQQDQEWVIHTDQVIDQLKALEARVVDAEASTRGYVATGDTMFLQPYHQALPQIATRLKTLTRLVADNPGQIRKVQQLERVVSNKIAILSELKRPNGSAKALLPIGKQRMDTVRKHIATLIQVEQQLLRTRQQELQADYGATSRLIWLLLVLALVNGGWSYWLVGHEFNRRKEVEQRLESSQQRYRSLVEHLKVVVFQTDSRGRWTYLNPGWENLTGFPVEASLGDYLVNAVLDEDRLSTQQLLEQIQAGSWPPDGSLLIRFRHRTGGYRWLEVLMAGTFDDQQQFVGLTGTLLDRTEAKQAQQALVESEQRFRAIAENVDEIFWVRDIHSPTFLYMNPSFERYTGISLETVYAHPLAFTQAIVEEDRPLVLEAFMSQQPRHAFRFRVHHPNGTIRWLSTRIFTKKNEAGQLTRRMGMATDITAALEKERRLEESLATERSFNALKSQFIATASHQFRTPLTAIKLSASLIQRYLHSGAGSVLTSKIHKQLATINHQVMTLTELINDTLTLSKIEAGQQRVELAAIDLLKLSEEVVSLFENREDGRQVELAVQGEPVRVSADKTLLSHVLTNLLSNAFKFSSSNPQLSIVYECHQVRVLVRDQGIGIPQADLAHLFGKFFRASNAGGISGTGLGLTICQEYMTLQHGRIEVASTEGEGTVFTVMLSLAATE
ncbi:PAS domain S-box protein [Spirosoma fluviale]|uniref:histidine kinase n=1 Tax=Spirosoma fluviale TaxID=1597977 RepID=A0A286G6A4_9BACT|nr:PAS domain S-box protein [Spirosoma fluviale]SOD90504.1 PAS domain S-box-containing protein [Spirosoma fluviale]